MIHMIKSAFSALLFVMLVCPNTAQAQGTFICGNGPPGEVERQVGNTPASSGVGSVPICTSDGPTALPGHPRPPQTHNLHQYRSGIHRLAPQRH